MSFWTFASFRSVTGGSWLRKPDASGADSLAGLGTDTRSLRRGQVFLALRGPRFDGHDFLNAAVAAGAPLLIVDDPSAVSPALLKDPRGPAVIRVRDTLRALAQLATAYRSTLDTVRVVSVCGSNGKTTTTRLIHAILSQRLRGSASPKSFNNEVGVPLTVLAARPADQYLVCEVGTNAPGEVARLAGIVRPDISVITSIGRAHMEHFDSLHAVAEEDAAIFVDLRPNGTAVVPAEEPALADFLKPVPHVVTFGRHEGADIRLSAVTHSRIEGGRTGLRFTLNDRSEYELPLIGRHNALNAAAAIAVARRLGLDDDEIRRGLLAVTPADLRLQHRAVRGVDLYVDCYNANPESVLAALETFSELAAGATRRVLVLGDMLEMGETAARCHDEIAEAASRVGEVSLVVTVGEHALRIAERVTRAHPRCRPFIVTTLDDAHAQRIAERLQPGDAVLLKASRAVRLERIIEALERTPNGAAGPRAAVVPAA